MRIKIQIYLYNFTNYEINFIIRNSAALGLWISLTSTINGNIIFKLCAVIYKIHYPCNTFFASSLNQWSAVGRIVLILFQGSRSKPNPTIMSRCFSVILSASHQYVLQRLPSWLSVCCSHFIISSTFSAVN